MHGTEDNQLFENGLFSCSHISPVDIDDIRKFTPAYSSGKGVVRYLQSQAITDEMTGAMRTYLIRDSETNELAAFFSLKAGLISGNETATEVSTVFDTLPGIELANFAVNKAYLDTHESTKGLGLVVFSDFILPIIENISNYVGAKFLYIFALPFEHLLERYVEYGFQRLPQKEEEDLHSRLKPQYDKGCIFMFQRIRIVSFP